MQAASRKTLGRLYAMPWRAIALRHWKLLLLMVAVIAVGAIWKVPQWQAAGWQGQMEPKDLAKLENDARTTLIQALGGAVLLIGLYFTLKNLQLTQDRQVTERYTRAVEQLGSDKLEVRLGSIYALERIAIDSERDYWPVMEILTAYLREHAPWPSTDACPSVRLSMRFPADLGAIRTVLGRRPRSYGRGEDQPLNLRDTDLRGVSLAGMHLEAAILVGSNLEGALLQRTHLEEANLAGAELRGADLCEVHLEGAFLWRAQLQGALLWEAHLKDASLEGTDLSNAIGLRLEQLTTVRTLYEAVLDSPLREQIQLYYPRLLQKPFS